jgi:hypothetical protein
MVHIATEDLKRYHSLRCKQIPPGVGQAGCEIYRVEFHELCSEGQFR